MAPGKTVPERSKVQYIFNIWEAYQSQVSMPRMEQNQHNIME